MFSINSKYFVTMNATNQPTNQNIYTRSCTDTSYHPIMADNQKLHIVLILLANVVTKYYFLSMCVCMCV